MGSESLVRAGAETPRRLKKTNSSARVDHSLDSRAGAVLPCWERSVLVVGEGGGGGGRGETRGEGEGCGKGIAGMATGRVGECRLAAKQEGNSLINVVISSWLFFLLQDA